MTCQRSIRRICAVHAQQVATKPFTAMPGPRGPLGMGNLYNYLPVVGKYSWQQLHRAGYDKYQQYGEIVRETMLPGTHIVWLYEPRDIAKVLNEKQYPQRRSHLALEKYRKDRPHVYKTAGLLPTNGSEWWRLRSELQKELSAPRSVRALLAAVDKVTQEFLSCLPVAESFDVLPYLARLNLELTGLLTFGQRFQAFSQAEMCSDSVSSRLIKATELTNSSILPTDQGLQLWRLFNTPTYKRLADSQAYMESVAVNYVQSHLETIKTEDTPSRCLIDKYLQSPNLDIADVIGTAADLLLAGIDTTSYTSAFALYHIACNPAAQQQLHTEAASILPTLYSTENFRIHIPYTRAVLKEVFRLNPISVGVGRILNKDTVLSGYLVPKGTVVVTQNMIACRLEKYFKQPLSFRPERWLQRDSAISPYLVLPFGHGMRSCIARRFAEQNMLILFLRLIAAYKISWTGSTNQELDVRTLLINKPAQPVTIKLEPR